MGTLSNASSLARVILLVAVAVFTAQSSPLSAASPVYYVDSAGGSDTNAGTSISKPWKTLTKVNSTRFAPGDSVYFKRGSTWSGELDIRDSGVQGMPITFADYGSGARPTISNPGVGSRVIKIFGSWVTVQGFLVRDSGDAAVEIETGANHNVIQNIEATNAGQGVSISGQYNLLTNNYAHDLTMIVNTPGGNDDYGALGFLIMNSDNEVSYNRCINCRAASYDYGYDGGVVEIYSNGDNSYIHHNYGSGSDGFIEVGVGTARKVRVAYNVSDNNYTHFACLHTGASFGSLIDDFRIENNTVINTTTSGWAVINCADVPLTGTQLYFRNNLVYTNMVVSNQAGFTHTNNLYTMFGDAQVGFALASGERLGDARLANIAGGDYRLQSASPAINSGVDLGYRLDYANQPVPQGGIPDMGAYEYVVSPPAPRQPISLFAPMVTR
jgi:hypothetical protein